MIETLQRQLRDSAVMKWYAGREAKERPIIAGLAAAFVILLLWSLIWKPLSDWRDIASNRYENAQTLHDWMRANEASARRAASVEAQGGSTQRSILPMITRAANGQGLTLNRLEPETNGAVSIVVQGQSFNTLLRWLNQLQENNGIYVQRISIDAEGQPGLINAQLRLH